MRVQEILLVVRGLHDGVFRRGRVEVDTPRSMKDSASESLGAVVEQPRRVGP